MVEPKEATSIEHLIENLEKRVSEYFERIPVELKGKPEVQEKCLQYLWEAEGALGSDAGRGAVISARIALARVEIELRRVRTAKYSYMLVLGIIYIGALAIVYLSQTGGMEAGVPAEELNRRLLVGIPAPILFWSVVGSLTSMLLRAGNLPFVEWGEAVRWMLFRPVVGTVMGVLTYLMVVAGLIVFAGNPNPRTPELLWVVAFVGSFSDTLSIVLLQKIMGRLEIREAKPTAREEKTKQTQEGG